MRRSLLPIVLGSIAFATVFAGIGQREAHAARYYYYGYGHRGAGREVDNGITLDVDGDLNIPVANSYQLRNGNTTVNPFNTGFGVDARLGFRTGNRMVFVQPEIEGGLEEFEWVNKYGFATSGTSLGRFMGGARLGARGIFEPQAFVHLGGADGGAGLSGFAWDAGGAANFHLHRVTFGAHIAFNDLLGSKITSRTYGTESLSVKWVSIGANAGIIF